MCYSQEVQLTTGSIIVLCSIYYYVVYSLRYEAVGRKWLLPFLRNVIIAYLFIGGHQLFEFLSLATQNQVVYKVGLLLSITGMFFYLRSLESLYNRNFRSHYFLWAIAGVAVYLFSIPMKFESAHFNVAHQSALVWELIWMIIFIYWHICAFRERQALQKDATKKFVLAYALAVFDLSFLLSLAYALFGYWRFGVNVCTETASIWCTFSVLQALSLPLFLGFLPRVLQRQPRPSRLPARKMIFFVVISVLILLILLSILPFFDCLSFKLAFP